MPRDTEDKHDAEIKKALDDMRKKAKEKQGPGKAKGRPKKDEKD
jgi:hypothetical protein